jgi:GcrA cell cycle regulator
LSDDVSAHIPAEVQTRFDIAGVPVPEHLNDIVKSQLPPTRQLALGTGTDGGGRNYVCFRDSVMQSKKRIWSEEDLERLRNLVQSGASAIRASVALKRPLEVVKLKARKIGVPFQYERELKKERSRILKS